MLIIKKEKLNSFLENLKKDFNFFEYNESVLPIKQYFFPAEQEIFNTKQLGSKINTAKSPEKFVIYGVPLFQLEALTQLDEIMKKPNEDFFYFQNRNQSIVIGLINESVDVAPGGDIVFQEIGNDTYVVFENTTKGKKLIKDNKEFFDLTPSSQETPSVDKETLGVDSIFAGDWSKSIRDLLADPELLSNAVEWSKDNKIWDELAEKCLGCGICTYVCPLCHCFSIEDRVGLDDKCSRCRKWTACTLPEFSKIAGGHSFRPTLKQRYYNWFYHKFVRAYNEYGKSQCVGCGNCKRACPAGIDIHEVLVKILDEFRKLKS